MDHGLGPVGQRPHPRPAVQGALLAHLGPNVGRRHREIPVVRYDPWRRTRLRQEVGTRIRQLVLSVSARVGDFKAAAIGWNIATATTFKADVKGYLLASPGGVQHLSLIAHGLADTLITPINDSLFDLDVLVEIERSNVKPQPSVYAKTVRRAIEARRKVSDRATNWIVVRNRQELIPSNNQRRVNRVLDVIQQTLGFRIARGLLERHVYREFFAEGLTVLDPIEKLKSATGPGSPNLLARLEVETLIREVGLIEDHGSLEMKSFTRSSWKWQEPAVAAKANRLERKKFVAQ